MEYCCDVTSHKICLWGESSKLLCDINLTESTDMLSLVKDCNSRSYVVLQYVCGSVNSNKRHVDIGQNGVTI
jgi:hypothetical protein